LIELIDDSPRLDSQHSATNTRLANFKYTCKPWRRPPASGSRTGVAELREARHEQGITKLKPNSTEKKRRKRIRFIFQLRKMNLTSFSG
jgi:hypothetical protein